MVVLYEQHTLTTKAASLMEKSIPLPVNDYMRRHGLFLVKFFSYTSKISVFILIHAKKHFDSQIYIFSNRSFRGLPRVFDKTQIWSFAGAT